MVWLLWATGECGLQSLHTQTVLPVSDRVCALPTCICHYTDSFSMLSPGHKSDTLNMTCVNILLWLIGAELLRGSCWWWWWHGIYVSWFYYFSCNLKGMTIVSSSVTVWCSTSGVSNFEDGDGHIIQPSLQYKIALLPVAHVCSIVYIVQ